MEHGFAHGGWCPRGRRAEDGVIAAQYQLVETPSRRYAQRTAWNVRDTDATVVFSSTQVPTGGTALTLAIARRLGKPHLILSSATTAHSPGEYQRLVEDAAERVLAFVQELRVGRLNVAGPRASQEPDVAEFAARVLYEAFAGPRGASARQAL